MLMAARNPTTQAVILMLVAFKTNAYAQVPRFADPTPSPHKHSLRRNFVGLGFNASGALHSNFRLASTGNCGRLSAESATLHSRNASDIAENSEVAF